MGIFGEERVYESQVPGPDEIFGKKPFCPRGLIELRNNLSRELDDERSASSKYRDAGIKLLSFKRPKAAADLAKIADDEHRHFLTLKAMIEVLDEECGCGDKGRNP